MRNLHKITQITFCPGPLGPVSSQAMDEWILLPVTRRVTGGVI